jgi:hypothetical protein
MNAVSEKPIALMTYAELFAFLKTGMNFKNAYRIHQTIGAEKSDPFARFSVRQRAELLTVMGGIFEAMSIAEAQKT